MPTPVFVVLLDDSMKTAFIVIGIFFVAFLIAAVLWRRFFTVSK